MAWSDAARRAAVLARKARSQYKSKDLRRVAIRSSLQDFRNKLWAKSLKAEGHRGKIQPHLRRPKWAMRGSQRRRS